MALSQTIPVNRLELFDPLERERRQVRQWKAGPRLWYANDHAANE